MATILTNGRCSDGRAVNLRLVDGRIDGFADRPDRHDLVVDLQSDRVLPGLINAHDHLQLNGLAGSSLQKQYANAREWIQDVDDRRRTDPAFKAQIARPRAARLLIGALKNLLSGVTTVAHHDPLYPDLTNDHFPVKVVQQYGWSHSLHVDGDEAVRASYRETPPTWPWLIHAAEGVNAEAEEEFSRLQTLDCIGANTLLIHGIAMGDSQRRQLHRAGGGLVWCPSSNVNLFGKTAHVTELATAGRVALGSDSRLSGSRDLLEELRVAGEIGELNLSALEKMVTSDSAQLLRIPDRGALRPGCCADILVLPADMLLTQARREDVRLVILDGIARYGDAEYAERMSPETPWTRVRVDGRLKVLHPHIASLLQTSWAQDAGLELLDLEGKAA